MNICQISSLDLLLCLQNGQSEAIPLTQSPFFQQVLAIAQEDHLVCISDYAVASFLQAELSPESQLQLEQLLNAIEIWQTTPAIQDQAQELSQTLKIALADAIDHVIYDHLCPDWILVAEEGRSLPNATTLAEFWREWIALRDDLPPSGGLSVGKYPPGGNGGGSPNDSGNANKNKSSHSGKLTPDSSLIASNSIVFSHRNFVAWSMGLYNITNLPVTTVRPPSQAAEPNVRPTVKLASSNLEESDHNLPINVRVVIDPATQQPTIVLMTADEVAALHLGHASPNPIATSPVIQNLVERFGRAIGPAQTFPVQITQAVQNVILRGGAQNDVTSWMVEPGSIQLPIDRHHLVLRLTWPQVQVATAKRQGISCKILKTWQAVILTIRWWAIAKITSWLVLQATTRSWVMRAMISSKAAAGIIC
jgi:hypothetical protein